jgi:hypothetical protein
MNRYLTITIDVEPDCTPNWRYSQPLSFNGVSEGIKKRLQPLFNKYSFPPTYLINNVVLEDAKSCEIFRKLEGNFELGTHLHPEFIEPDKKEYDYSGKKAEANCCFLPPEKELKKLETITNLFETQFNYRPKSFRAGRFSAGDNTIKSLEKLGYTTDTSVTPHIKWSDRTREHPVDYEDAKEQPYFMKSGHLLQEDTNGPLLQVPVTISLRETSLIKELKRTYLGLRHKIEARRPLWLRPVFSGLNDFVSITEEFTTRYGQNENVILNMMFHNVEVMPGLSPYTHTESDCKAYMEQLEKFFIFCKNNNIRGLTLNDVFKIYR